MLGIEGNIFAALALLCYIPFAISLFAFLPPRKAVIYGFIISWLFLPMSHLALHGFTDLNKMSAACAGTLIGAPIFDGETVFSFRPKIWDIPMFVWCVCPFISSMGNLRGPYDGFSAVAYQTTSWGLPYFVGRIYFNDLKGLRELAVAIVVGGLLYVPFCWFEIRMSPQLHAMVYGYHQHDFAQTIRYHGYRPMVFMEHGLAVASWMVTASLTAFWLWRSGSDDKVFGMGMGWASLILIITSVCLRSLGAECLMVVGLIALSLTAYTRSVFWILMLTLIPPTWITLRTTNWWDGKNFLDWVQHHDPHTYESMHMRFRSERILSDRALLSPIYGWTPWHFMTAANLREQKGVPDQLWIIAFGQFGLIGLCSLNVALLMPIWLVIRKIPLRYWKNAGAAAPAVLSMVVTLHMIDDLFNAMINPIFIICAGGLTVLNFSFQTSGETASRAAVKTTQPAAIPYRPGAAPA